MGSKKKKSDEDQDEDMLPETGITTPDGHLFYHISPVELTKRQLQRVKEHGVNLRAERSFTLEEAVQIFKNWKEYAEENKLKLTKASEYIGAKKTDKLLTLHQQEHQFWPKLCSGLPHRTCIRVKTRAQSMMTDAFLKDLNWEDPTPQIADKYYHLNQQHESLDLAKIKKLVEKGYSASHVAEILDIPLSRTRGMVTKLNRLETRTDPEMVQMVFESACTSGLDVLTIKKYLPRGDEEKYLRKTLKHIKFDEMSLKIHISEMNLKRFLKQNILKAIWKKYQEAIKDGEKNEEEAMEEAMEIVSRKPELTREQELKALEIFCQKCEKDETMSDLREDGELKKILRTNGITGFHCKEPEFVRLCYFVFWWTRNIDNDLFSNLRREFRYRLKMHCTLWGCKKNDVWSTLPVKKDETRYEAVLRHELSNPFVSEMTKRFLKNQSVAQWIMEPIFSKSNPDKKEYRGNLFHFAVEAFILYAHHKYKGEFKFPAKLHHLTTLASRSSGVIHQILEECDDNSEFLSQKEVKQTVESASDAKIAVKLRKKAFYVKRHVDDESDEEEEEEDFERLKEEMREMEAKMVENMKEEIAKAVEKADPMKRKKKFRDMDDEGDEEAIHLKRELLAQKRALDRAKRKNEKTKKETKKETTKETKKEKKKETKKEKKKEKKKETTKVSKQRKRSKEFKSRETVSLSEESNEEEDDSPSVSNVPEDQESSVGDLKESSKKSTMRKLEKDASGDEEGISTSEYTAVGRSEHSDDDFENEAPKSSKKKSRKRKLEHNDDDETQNEPETHKDPEVDLESSEKSKKFKKSKKMKKERQDSD